MKLRPIPCTLLWEAAHLCPTSACIAPLIRECDCMYVPMNVRECIRHDGWSDRVQLRRRAQHFIFTVESTGCISAVDIVTEVRGETRPTIGGCNTSAPVIYSLHVANFMKTFWFYSCQTFMCFTVCVIVSSRLEGEISSLPTISSRVQTSKWRHVWLIAARSDGVARTSTGQKAFCVSNPFKVEISWFWVTRLQHHDIYFWFFKVWTFHRSNLRVNYE